MAEKLISAAIIYLNYLHIFFNRQKKSAAFTNHLLEIKAPLFSILLFLFLNLIGKSSSAQIVGQYTGIDFATSYTNPVQGGPCSNIAAINAAIGDANFINGTADIPLGWQFSGTWNSGLTYYNGPGTELLLVSLHTYAEQWYVALRLSNGTTTVFLPYALTIVTTNANGTLTFCGGVSSNTNYERPSQELDFASYTIPAGIGVIGIIFEPFADGAADPDPHGVLVLQGTSSALPCDTSITTTQSICQGDSVLFQGIYYGTTGTYVDSLTNVAGCDSILSLNLTVNPKYLITRNQSICQGDSVLLDGSFQTITGVYTDSLQTNFGCDSIIVTNLTVNPTYLINQKLAICVGDSILLGGSFQTTAGLYTDSLQTNFGCDSIVTTTLTIRQFADAGITFDNSLCVDDSSIFMTAAITGGLWSGIGITNSVTGQFNPNIAGAGEHAIVYNFFSTCATSDTVIVIVVPECKLEIPNVFTPNGDGSNDFLVFKNLENSPNNHLIIYNRWGQNIFETDSYKNNWNGDAHAAGTYFFILQVNNSETTYKGFFIMMK
jgi:gliding motility-associated-like protein